MITVQEALAHIKTASRSFESERVPLADSMGRILAEDWMADRDFPPFNRVMMDGIAVQYDTFQKGQRSYKIEGIAAAGSPLVTLEKDGCIEVMTGAMLPNNTDTIIRYEDIKMEDGFATILIDDIRAHQNIHSQGKDQKAGDLLVKQGTQISPAEIGVAASIGKHQVKVVKQPKIIIISTGDELVDIHQTPEAHQIRKSNVYQLQSVLKTWGFSAETAHLKDEPSAIKTTLASFIQSYDLIILSGGVSMGKFDYIPSVLKEIGVQEIFHKVRQRPGKPLWFGSTKNCTVFGLPGNPISSFVCAQKYIRSWFDSCGLLPTTSLKARLSERVHFKPSLHYFLLVKLHTNAQGQIIATPQYGNGSGDLANLTKGDAFIELPEGMEVFEEGGVYEIFRV